MSALLVLVSLALIFIFIGKEALPLFTSPEVRQEANMEKLFLPQSTNGGARHYSWQPVSSVPKYSVIPLLIGTLKATFVALLFAIPLAIGASIYTSEFAPGWVREIVKPVIELLAGIPSVVLGFFSLMILASVLQDVFHITYRLNALNSGPALGLAVIPIVYTVSEDAFSSVPQAYREGSFAMGATSWQTAWRVVLPAAFPGIFAACVLGLGRAVGETMIVLMASGNAPFMSASLGTPLRTLSATIAAELGEVVVGSAHYHVLFFIGTFLFVITFLTNLLGSWFVERLRKRLLGVSS